MHAEDRFQGERRYATIIFADIKDSTALIAGEDPERAIEVLDPIVNRMVAAVEEFGGVVSKVMGDGIMAIFGAPTAIDKHQIQACHAALAIQRELNEGSLVRGMPEGMLVPVRVGIHSGEVVIQSTGEGPTRHYDAQGFNVHLASRIEGLANPGAIAISDSTYRAVSHLFKCADVGLRKVKGSPKPIHVFELLEQRQFDAVGAHGDWRPLFDGYVGRESELDHLQSMINETVKGHGSIVGIVGDAGIGKTRFVAELRERSQHHNLLWLLADNSSATRNLPYWLLVRVMMGYFKIEQRDSIEIRAEKLRGKIEALFADKSQNVLPYIGAFIGVPPPEDLAQRVAHLDGEALRKQIFRAIRRLIRRIADQQPLVIVLDDVSFADNASIELAEHLFPLVLSHPILICFISRNQPDGADTPLRIAASKHYTSAYKEIRLEALSQTESRLLLGGLLAQGNLPSAVRKEILAKAQGNPLFLEEVTRGFAGSGLAEDKGGPIATQNTSSHYVPDTVRQVILARTDQLDHDLLDTLRMASVLGRTFNIAQLQSLQGMGKESEKLLESLEQLDFVRRKGNRATKSFEFKHMLVHDAIYDSIMHRQRRDLHNSIGTEIESRPEMQRDNRFGILAFHYSKAENWEKAHYYLLKAGDHANALAGDAEALAHYREALDIYSLAFSNNWDPIERAKIDGKIGTAYYRRRERSEAIEYFERALIGLNQRCPTSRTAIRYGLLRHMVQRTLHMTLTPGKAKPLQSSATAREIHILEIYVMLWWSYFFSDPERSGLCAFEAMRVSERCGHIDGLAWGTAMSGFLFDAIGFPRLGGLYHSRAAAAANLTGQPLAIGVSALGAAWHETFLGHWQKAIKLFETAGNMNWKIGELEHWAASVFSKSFVLTLQGNFDVAEKNAEILLNIGLDTRDANAVTGSKLILSMVQIRRGMWRDAIENLEEVCAFGREEGDHINFLLGGSELIYARQLQGDLDGAVSLAEELENEIRLRHLKGHHVALVLNRVAEMHLAEYAAGKQVGMLQIKRACRRALSGGKIFRGALPSALRLEGIRHWVLGDKSGANRCWEKSLVVARALPSPYEEAQTLREISRYTGDQSSHLKAEQLVFELGLETLPHTYGPSPNHDG